MPDHIPKPPHLSPDYAAQFQDASVARGYQYRSPYPEELFPILIELIGQRTRKVLDLGTGTGSVARGLADLVERVDAVDNSRPLLEVAKTLPKGDRANIRWICGSAEEAVIDPPYGLVTAGSSLHWMDWYVVLPRVGAALEAGGYLAIFEEQAKALPWGGELGGIIPRYSTNKEFRPFTVVEELLARELFKVVGRVRTGCMPFSQSVDEHIESMHARNGFSRDRMAAEFDREFGALVEPHCPDGVVRMEVFTEVTYGIPAP